MPRCPKIKNCFKKKGSERGHLLDIKSALGEKKPKCSLYISFAQADRKFVKHVRDSLITDKREVACDFNVTYANASELFEDIHVTINNHDVFVVVLSNASIDDQMVKLETDHALKVGKRIIPVVKKEVDVNRVRTDITAIPTWVIFQPDRFQKSIDLLIKAVDADPLHAIYHRHLLVNAIDWEKADFEKSKLLIGEDLVKARHWLSASALGKQPRPTTLHLSYITASESLSSSMKKRSLIAVFFAFIVVIGIIWPSWGVFFFSLIFSHFFVYFASN